MQVCKKDSPHKSFSGAPQGWLMTIKFNRIMWIWNAKAPRIV